MSGHCTKAGALCEEMVKALEAGTRVVGGLAITTGEADSARIVYRVPGHGKGRARKHETSMVFTYCAFCGGTLR